MKYIFSIKFQYTDQNIENYDADENIKKCKLALLRIKVITKIMIFNMWKACGRIRMGIKIESRILIRINIKKSPNM
jgi:hypothetical protein